MVEVFKPNFKRTVDGIPGLAIVVVQSAITEEVLMVAFTDEAGWKQTMETGMASLYSTSRKKSWVKGEESGNYMKVAVAKIDCDGDTLVYFVDPQGEGLACHTGARTCFYRDVVVGDNEDPPPPKEGTGERLEQIDIELHPNFLRP